MPINRISIRLSYTDTFLTNLLLDSIQQLLDVESIVITYSQLSYHQILLNELLSQKVIQLPHSIIEALYYLTHIAANHSQVHR